MRYQSCPVHSQWNIQATAKVYYEPEKIKLQWSVDGIKCQDKERCMTLWNAMGDDVIYIRKPVWHEDSCWITAWRKKKWSQRHQLQGYFGTPSMRRERAELNDDKKIESIFFNDIEEKIQFILGNWLNKLIQSGRFRLKHSFQISWS